MDLNLNNERVEKMSKKQNNNISPEPWLVNAFVFCIIFSGFGDSDFCLGITHVHLTTRQADKQTVAESVERESISFWLVLWIMFM